MTHSAPLEIREQLDGLCSALTKLDSTAVEEYSSVLLALAPGLRGRAMRAEEFSDLRAKLQFARTLTDRAVQLYAGLARLAALHGAAYSPSGDEALSSATSSVAVQA
jgi:hypothetical protein